MCIIEAAVEQSRDESSVVVASLWSVKVFSESSLFFTFDTLFLFIVYCTLITLSGETVCFVCFSFFWLRGSFCFTRYFFSPKERDIARRWFAINFSLSVIPTRLLRTSILAPRSKRNCFQELPLRKIRNCFPRFSLTKRWNFLKLSVVAPMATANLIYNPNFTHIRPRRFAFDVKIASSELKMNDPFDFDFNKADFVCFVSLLRYAACPAIKVLISRSLVFPSISEIGSAQKNVQLEASTFPQRSTKATLRIRRIYFSKKHRKSRNRLHGSN